MSNAIALTTLHRKLFHLGVFTVDADYRIRISGQASEHSLPGLLDQFAAKKISVPSNQHDQPDKECLEWHASEVFRG